MVIDQAQNLRELARQSTTGAPPYGSTVPLVAVTGGKGGVGVSTVAFRLAMALQQHGQRTLFLEADLDRGGIVEPGDCGGSIADCLAGTRSLIDVCQPGPQGMLVVPGAWAPRQMADCTALAQRRLLAELQRPGLHADIAVIDLGSSRNAFVQRFWQVASMVIVVATPDTACVMDAYAAIKVLHAGDTSLPIYTLLNLAGPKGSEIGFAESTSVLTHNRLSNHSALHDPGVMHQRIARTCRRFLGLRTSTLGSIPAFDDLTSDAAHAAVEHVAAVLATELGLTLRQCAPAARSA